jgi:hypothetical protein
MNHQLTSTQAFWLSHLHHAFFTGPVSGKQWDGLLLTPLRRQRAIMMSESNHHLVVVN